MNALMTFMGLKVQTHSLKWQHHRCDERIQLLHDQLLWPWLAQAAMFSENIMLAGSPCEQQRRH